MPGITAVILAGGQGQRLRAAVADRPKPLAEVGGRPFLAYLLDQIHDTGIGDVVLCTGYRSGQVEDCFGDSYRGMTLRYSVETEALGTAGALRQALPLVHHPRVVILNGDSICRIELRRFLTDSATEDCSMVAVAVPDAAEFGRLILEPGDRVLSFCEKDGRTRPGWINAGIYAMSRARLAALPACQPLSLERDVLPRLADLRAWRTRAPFLDIGTPQRYALAEPFLASRARGLILLDRDGTVIVERNYLSDPDQVELLPGAAQGIRRLRAAGYRIGLVTNQSGIARGYFSPQTLERIHERLEALLQDEGTQLDGIWTCHHHPEDRCPCRKPMPGMIEAATSTFGVPASDTIVVGDKDCDINLGHRAGARSVLVRSGYGRLTEQAGHCNPDLCVDSLAELADQLLDESATELTEGGALLYPQRPARQPEPLTEASP